MRHGGGVSQTLGTLVTVAERRGGKQRIPRPESYQVGGPPPWSALDPERRRFTLAEIRARLDELPPPRDAVELATGSRASAVLVPLYEIDGETFVVLIKRPDTMPSHKGEIAFPGGKLEPGVDADLRATALREAHEEIGLDPAAVEVVRQLDGIGTVATRFTITPFVGFLSGRPTLAPNPREVVRVIEVPLAELLDPDWFREEHWEMSVNVMGGVHFYELDDETVWGATARILTSFLAHLVAGREPS
jgi:8-oxo-dGTP pyrophosphatase MutT (NUDIX family)